MLYIPAGVGFSSLSFPPISAVTLTNEWVIMAVAKVAQK